MKVDLICEVGINHDGDFAKAMKMIEACADTGVKICKFQFYDPLKLLGPDSPYLAYATRCQFTRVQHELLKQVCDMYGLEYLVSVFDIADIPWADSLCKRHKVASRMNKDNSFVGALRETGKQVIMSVQNLSADPFRAGDYQMRYMYCITEYPTPVSELSNLPCNEHLGLSSHCPSIKPSIDALAQGATLIEHHVKFAGDEDGCDKSSSITFDQLAQLNLIANTLEVV